MIEMICGNCNEPFTGRPNRRTCSVDCRRELEYRRKSWDRQFEYVDFCETQANFNEWLTDEQRRNWQKEAYTQREEILKTCGPRP